jgi:phosphate:Na+ symporter
MVIDIIVISFKLLGALGLFMYGMQLSSEGIQRAAGDRLQSTVNFMTRNRVVAVFTGVIVTVLLQSSSATTVMVVSFVNAGLLSLVQAIGVIMGANIGTTLTGWIIAAVGVQKFSIALVAIPLFGIGFFMSLWKTRGDAFVSYGEGLMGFALIFLGLEYLAKAIPDPSPDALLFLRDFEGRGWIATLSCVLVGVVFTALINASSATIAIVIGLSAKGVINFEMAAAITLGANIGTTFDSFLVSLGTNTNAKRAAWAHIMFNVVGTVWVIIVLRPFIQLVDWITPGVISPVTAGAHIAMLHTLFNTANTLVLLPFVRQYARALERVIKAKPGEEELARLQYRTPPLLSSPEINVARARGDIAELARVSGELFGRLRCDLAAPAEWTEEDTAHYERHRAYADAAQAGISKFLLEIARQDISDRTRDSIGALMKIATDYQSACAGCASIAALAAKGSRKNAAEAELEGESGELESFAGLVGEFISFVNSRLDVPLSAEDLEVAVDYENRVDAERARLKREARKRIKKGGDVKAELQFIDIIRHLEKIGDSAYSVAMTLRETGR